MGVCDRVGKYDGIIEIPLTDRSDVRITVDGLDSDITIAVSIGQSITETFTFDGSAWSAAGAVGTLIDNDQILEMGFDLTNLSAGDVGISITATDGGNSETFANPNFTGAKIIASPISDTNSSNNSVTEGLANGEAVGITAYWGDGATYVLTDDANGLFQIDSASGVVTVSNALGLDYEFAQSHDIVVQATAGWSDDK